MKETVLDVLMYLFDNYMDVDSDFSVEEESIRGKLLDAGFSETKIGKAFLWLKELIESEKDFSMMTDKALRIYTEEEHLNVECQGFLLSLEQIGLLSPSTRERVVDRVMALEIEEIDREQLKWVVLMVLYNQPGQEAAFTWMEELVFGETPPALH